VLGIMIEMWKIRQIILKLMFLWYYGYCVWNNNGIVFELNWDSREIKKFKHWVIFVIFVKGKKKSIKRNDEIMYY